MKRLFSIILISVLMANLGGCQKSMTERHFFAMDTVMTLQLDTDDQEVFDQCIAEVERLESLFSVTKEKSEIARLNRGEQIPLSVDTNAILQKGLALSAETKQSFCLSLYPASALWDFGGTPRIPADAELEAVRPLIDDTALSLSEASLTLPTNGGIDLGGIAKGYTADTLTALLAEQQIDHYFLSLGGNVQVGGGNLDGNPWRVGIADPNGGDPIGIVRLSDGAVVTSGGYQRNFTQGDKTYHHILDRATLAPANSGLLSATAITADGTTADALSTAFFVMGEEKALAYCAARDGVDCVLVTDDQRIVTSDGVNFTLNHSEYSYE